MTKRGHANSCPACLYASLSDEAKSQVSSTAIEHRRQEPPIGPNPPYWPIWMLGGGFLLLAASILLGGIVMGLALVAWISAIVRYRRIEAEWRPKYEAWRMEQTEVWLKRRAKSKLWPCPTCGGVGLSEPTLHNSHRPHRAWPLRLRD